MYVPSVTRGSLWTPVRFLGYHESLRTPVRLLNYPGDLCEHLRVFTATRGSMQMPVCLPSYHEVFENTCMSSNLFCLWSFQNATSVLQLKLADILAFKKLGKHYKPEHFPPNIFSAVTLMAFKLNLLQTTDSSLSLKSKTSLAVTSSSDCYGEKLSVLLKQENASEFNGPV